MEKQQEIFTYTYSAAQREEVQSIRRKYLPPEDKWSVFVSSIALPAKRQSFGRLCWVLLVPSLWAWA